MKKLTALFLAAVLLLAPLSALALGRTDEQARDGVISEVNIEGFVPPVIGSSPEFSYTLHVDEEMPYFIVYQYWHDNTAGCDMFIEQEPFLEDHMYSIGCILAAREGYVFAEDCVYCFNGDPELFDPEFFHEYYLWDETYVVQTVAVAPVPEIPDFTPGDVNDNGEIDLTDALLALRGAMGIIELPPAMTMAADVSGDGEVTLEDALRILRFGMGIAAEL